eukprot:391106-Pelagomonas_calceolata.AAC.8
MRSRGPPSDVRVHLDPARPPIHPISFAMRGLSEHVPEHAPLLHLNCAHSQPLHLIGTVLALKCSWRYKLPEHMHRFE